MAGWPAETAKQDAGEQQRYPAIDQDNPGQAPELPATQRPEPSIRAITVPIASSSQIVPGSLPACRLASVRAPKATNSPCGMKITRVTAKTRTRASASSA
jgi:hypothetical protein